ncbi:MAG: Rpn family recombination-promoting nuclease/putative transposase [Planctomycetaceae bacterium]|jgi:hypothetical protein|nr:Rpn family recombination-promoting nuclease/putative transposase [Planctomycetaceae bacterium]
MSSIKKNTKSSKKSKTANSVEPTDTYNITSNSTVTNSLSEKDRQTIINMLAKSHDKLFRSVLKDDDIACDFFENYLDPAIVEMIDFSELRCCLPENIDKDLKERIGDLRFFAKCKPSGNNDGVERILNVTFIFEHQSTPDPIMSVRIHESIAHGNRHFLDNIKYYFGKKIHLSKIRLPYPIVVIVYNGKRKWQYKNLAELIDIPAGFDKNILFVPVIVIDVSRLTKEKLKRGRPVVRAMLHAFRYEKQGTLLENFEDVFKILAEAKNDIRINGWFNKFIRYVTSHCNIKKGKEIETLEKIYSIINQNPEEVKTMAESMAFTLLKQGYIQGKEEEGKNYIIECLSRRFKISVPQDIQDSVNSYSDLTAIKSLFQRALDCESIDEFREYLVR